MAGARSSASNLPARRGVSLARGVNIGRAGGSKKAEPPPIAAFGGSPQRKDPCMSPLPPSLRSSRAPRFLVLASGLLLALFSGACNGWLLEELEEHAGSGHSSSGGPAPSPTNTCTYGGKDFPEGATVSSDGCNTCYCKGGGVVCTSTVCEPPPPPANTCAYQGKDYPEGASIPKDECNACYCKGGSWSCATVPSCVPTPPPPPVSCVFEGKPLPEGATVVSSDGCKICTCLKGGVTCKPEACPSSSSP